MREGNAMLEGFTQEIVLKAKARTGASGELFGWFFAVAFFSLFAVIFLSVAAYDWLAALYGGPIPGAVIGGTYIVLAGAALTRCIVLKRRTATRALAQLRAEQNKTPPWWSDPSVLTIGYEVAKAVGWRKLTPIIAIGVLAASLGRKNGAQRPARGNHNGA
jgi:hypothetical protein